MICCLPEVTGYVIFGLNIGDRCVFCVFRQAHFVSDTDNVIYAHYHITPNFLVFRIKNSRSSVVKGRRSKADLAEDGFVFPVIGDWPDFRLSVSLGPGQTGPA